jgi:hypothetical protein
MEDPEKVAAVIGPPPFHGAPGNAGRSGKLDRLPEFGVFGFGLT